MADPEPQASAPPQRTCLACAMPIPAAASRCYRCGADQSQEAPAAPLFTDRPVFRLISGVAGLITSLTVILGVGSYLGSLVTRSETRVMDISPNAVEWYLGYENIGNAPARIGTLILSEIAPEGTGGTGGERSYLPLDLVGSADALFLAPNSSRAIKIPFDTGAARAEGTICELKADIFEHAATTPRSFLFRRACPVDDPATPFDRPTALEITGH